MKKIHKYSTSDGKLSAEVTGGRVCITDFSVSSSYGWLYVNKENLAELTEILQQLAKEIANDAND